MIEDEAETINEIIVKREKDKRKGNEVEAEEMKELLEKAGFEIQDNKETTTVKAKLKENI